MSFNSNLSQVSLVSQVKYQYIIVLLQNNCAVFSENRGNGNQTLVKYLQLCKKTMYMQTCIQFAHSAGLFTYAIDFNLSCKWRFCNPKNKQKKPWHEGVVLCTIQTDLAWRRKTHFSCVVCPQGWCKRLSERAQILVPVLPQLQTPAGRVSMRRKSRKTCVSLWGCLSAQSTHTKYGRGDDRESSKCL